MNQDVILGDVFDELSSLQGQTAHCAIVDYPWEFSIQTGTGRYEYRGNPRGRGEGDRNPEHEEVMFAMESDERFPELLDELSRVLVDGAWVIFMADDRFQDTVRKALRESEFILRRNWVWTPESMGMGTYGRIDHYPMPVATLGETERYVRDRATLFRVPGGRQTEYPTGKPVELYRQILRAPVIEDGERLLEPFCGAGPGAAVAAERGLDYWGCDISAEAVEVSTSNFNQSRLNKYVHEHH